MGVLLSQAPVWAVFGIGVHGGIDMLTIDQQDLITFNLIDSSNVALTREEISNPYHFGVHVFLDMIPAPFIDELDLSLDFSSKKYRYEFTNPAYSLTESQIQPEEVNYGRVGVEVSIRHYLAKFPAMLETVRLYVGVGFGMQMISPLVSRDLVYDNLFNSTNPLNLEEQDVINKSSRASFVGLVGFRIKPPLIPLSVRAEGRYHAMGEWDYEQPGNFFSISLGLSYSM